MSITNCIKVNKPEDTDGTISDIDIIRCLLYCFQGIESNWIVFNQNEKQFTVTAKLDYYQNIKIKRLIEIGYLHNIIQEYIENNSNNKNGAIASGIAYCLHEELCVYYESINKLLNEVNEAYSGSKYYSFGNLLCWSVLWLGHLQDLANTVKMIDNSKYGGEVISIIVPISWCENPYLKQMAINMIKSATRPVFITMSHWMVDGELLDSFNEFFICQCSDSTISDNLELWNSRYTIRESMVPAFFTKEDVNRIFHTGRYINFLHNICKIKPDLTPSRKILMDLRNSGDKDLYPMLEKDSIISDIINKACTESSTIVLDILKDKFELFLHFEGLRRYMLLGQGDFVSSLLEILQVQLDKLSSSLGSIHTFRNILDIAIRMSNAQNDNPVILKTLDIKLLHTSGEDSCWDIFQLDYSTGGPLETIFEFSGNGRYSIMFTFLWRLKRIDFVLSKMWRELNLQIKSSYYIVPEIRYALKSTNILVNEMFHSIRQIQFYVMSDVIETEWELFRKAIAEASLLESVIEAHDRFLKNIFKRSMQTEETHDLSKKMRQLFDSVLELRGIQQKFHSQSQCELKRRKDLEKYIEVHGTSYEIEKNDIDIKETFLLEVDRYENVVIKQISISFKNDLAKFLKKLIKVSSNDQEALHSLVNRINFNQYYSKNDEKLEKCTTVVSKLNK